MRDLGKASLNLFYGSWQSTPAKTLTLAQALDEVRNGVHRRQVMRVRHVLASQGKLAYDKAKAQLPAYTFGGTFAPRRGIPHLQQHSGIVHGDLDHLADAEGLKRAIAGDRYTAYIFISPSRGGLKIGVHVPVVTDDARYKHAWAQVASAYTSAYGVGWDPNGKDVSRLCFVSDDPTAYWNQDAEVFPVPPLPSRKPPAPQRSSSREGYRDQDYADRAVATAVRMIQRAELGTRHHTRFKAARLLGGYVAGGLLTEQEAYGALAQALVGHTEDLERALKTVEDGLGYGQAHPITIEALEAERRAWLEQHFPVDRDSTPLARARDVLGASKVCDNARVILLPLRPYAPYQGYRKGAWHG